LDGDIYREAVNDDGEAVNDDVGGLDGVLTVKDCDGGGGGKERKDDDIP
jgi:hypothetical protein